MERIRIATRQSPLALWQANFVKDELERHWPDLVVELVGMTTKGDRWLKTSLSKIGGKGLFVKELEDAMLDGRADIAVHSAKDLPVHMPEGFTIPVLAFRAEVNDVLISPVGNVDQLPNGARVGSSSLRRQAQLLFIRPDLEFVPIRGNVATRLAHIDDGRCDAIVLADAGLRRLGIVRGDVYRLGIEECLPAPGQGALAIECLDNPDILSVLQPLTDPQVAHCVRAERGISAGLGADCSLPVAAYATLADSGQLTLRALVCDPTGARIVRSALTGSDPVELAERAVAELLEQGAASILASAKH